MIKIGILALDNCYASSVYGPFDVFSVANFEHQSRNPEEDQPLFAAEIYSIDGKPVSSSSNLTIKPCSPISSAEDLDILILPAILGDTQHLLKSRPLKGYLQDSMVSETCICSVCAGSLILAEAGLLDGKQATTHWALSEIFKKQYQTVDLKPQKMLVDEGDLITAGGITAYLDLSLYLVQRFASKELSIACSKILLIDQPRTSQTPYKVADFNRNHGDSGIDDIQLWLEKNFNQNLTISNLAEKAKLGERTFVRRFKKATGDLPSEYIQRLRIESARNLLESTTKSIDEITWAVGYEDSNSFRRLFKKRTGLSPGSYRKKFSLIALSR